MATNIPENFRWKGTNYVECKECEIGIYLNNLEQDEDAQTFHDSINNTCSSRSSSRSVSSGEGAMFVMGKDGVYEPSKELAKRRQQNKENVTRFTSKTDVTSGLPHTKESSHGSLKGELKVLENENKKLKLNDKCKRCKVNEATVMVFPCRHFNLCRECAVSAERCIVCNASIGQKTQIADNRADNYL